MNESKKNVYLLSSVEGRVESVSLHVCRRDSCTLFLLLKFVVCI